MSSDADYVALLTRIQTELYRYGGPILIILGTMNCILSLLIFTKKNLRKNPCSIYFIAYNVISLIVIYTILLPQTLATAYNIDPTSYNLVFCRFHFYIILSTDALGPSYFILASIDRILLTSRNASTRQRSTARLAYLSVALVTFFWLLSTSHTLVFVVITQPRPGSGFCFFQMGSYYTFISYYMFVAKGLLWPLLMVFFGLWSIRNVRSLVHVQPDSTAHVSRITQPNAVRHHSKDHQLFRILINNIVIYLVFNLFLSIVLIYEQIDTSLLQTYVGSQLYTFYLVLGGFSTYIPYCIEFYNNLLVSKTFRNAAKIFFYVNMFLIIINNIYIGKKYELCVKITVQCCIRPGGSDRHKSISKTKYLFVLCCIIYPCL